MVALTTPICHFDEPAHPFTLSDASGQIWTLEQCKGEKGLLVMFICNHCPFVKSILPRLVEQAKTLQEQGIGVVAINANDPALYEEDSPEHMLALSQSMDFSFPYLIDATQEVAKTYGAVCTPDFFGYNHDLGLQYRGRFDDTKMDKPSPNAKAELLEAMQQIAKTGKGPQTQVPSIGCSIKWKNED